MAHSFKVGDVVRFTGNWSGLHSIPDTDQQVEKGDVALVSNKTFAASYRGELYHLLIIAKQATMYWHTDNMTTRNWELVEKADV